MLSKVTSFTLNTISTEYTNYTIYCCIVIKIFVFSPSVPWFGKCWLGYLPIMGNFVWLSKNGVGCIEDKAKLGFVWVGSALGSDGKANYGHTPPSAQLFLKSSCAASSLPMARYVKARS